MTDFQLDQLKKDARTLYSRGHISQSLCVKILGFKKSDSKLVSLIQYWVYKLANYAVHA